MIHILLIVIGIVLIVVNRDIKNERGDDGGSFANILKNEEKEFTDYDMKFVDMRKDMAESILDLQKEIQEVKDMVRMKINQEMKKNRRGSHDGLHKTS